MGDEKMSKSLGNVKLIHDLLKDWDGEVIRLALLKAHYRSELVWTESLLEESKAQLDGWYRAISDLKNDTNLAEFEMNSMLNDLATPSFISDISRDLIITPGLIWTTTLLVGRSSANLLGLLQKDPEDWFKGGASADEEAEFDAIALRREQARAQKDWAAADAARDEATAKGIVLEAGPDGTTWRKA